MSGRWMRALQLEAPEEFERNRNKGSMPSRRKEAFQMFLGLWWATGHGDGFEPYTSFFI